MAKDNRKEYIVELGGVEHVFLLTPDDAERYPNAKLGSAKAVAERAVAAQAAANAAGQKAVEPENKADVPENK